MPKPTGKPWQKQGRPGWWATVRGQQVNLKTNDFKEAVCRRHELLAAEPSAPVAIVAGEETPVIELLDAYLAHLQERGRDDFGWYRTRIQSFVSARR